MSEAAAIRVLLVEDDEDVRLSTAQMLTLAGFEVESFASAERARAQISFGAPVIVVCDVRLPGLSGTEWLVELRNADALFHSSSSSTGWSNCDFAGCPRREGTGVDDASGRSFSPK